MEMPTTANGTMKPASADDIINDEHGFTNPNLHRRTDIQAPPAGSEEVSPRDYTIGVYDKIHSTRMTEIHYHDEESETDEVP